MREGERAKSYDSCASGGAWKILFTLKLLGNIASKSFSNEHVNERCEEIIIDKAYI